MKTKKEKRLEAIERQEKYDKMTIKEKMALIRKRTEQGKGESKREKMRLENKLAAFVAQGGKK
jgi:hypothetical protein